MPRAVFSHAHGDHARALCGRVYATAETAAVARLRLGETEYVVLPTGQPVDLRRPGFAPCRLTLFPAGHVLGSALVRVEGPSGSLLYTGDVNLAPSLTCRPAEVPEADVLVTEATFGLPSLKFPPVEELRERIVAEARAALGAGVLPVFLGYAFGKGPEVAKILLEAGVAVSVHHAIARLLPVYRSAGIRFDGVKTIPSGREGRHGKSGQRVLRGLPPRALVVPPSSRWHPAPGAAGPFRTIAVTGRALLDPGKPPHRSDVAIPLSDHADFEGLLRVAELSRARTVRTTHGFAAELAEALRERGTDARVLLPEG